MKTDQSLLKELISSLLNNALKYTPERGDIGIRVWKQGQSIVFRIQDNGFGIPRHQHQMIFKKFFRGDNVVDKVTKGTGLGLYLASLLTNLLGGTIQFESEEEKGTTFTLVFPLTRELS